MSNKETNPTSQGGAPASTEWEILEPILDDDSLTASEKAEHTAQEREKEYEEYAQREFSSTDYENFAHDEIDSLFQKLQLPVNQEDPESKTVIVDQIETCIDLLDLAEQTDSETAENVFDKIEGSYLEAAEKALKTDKESEANAFGRKATSVKTVKQNFISTMMENEAIARNQAAAAQLEKLRPEDDPFADGYIA